MELHDLDRYLRLVAPPDTSQLQIENLTVMRLTYGRPLTVMQYEALRIALADHEAECSAEPAAEEPITLVICEDGAMTPDEFCRLYQVGISRDK